MISVANLGVRVEIDISKDLNNRRSGFGLS